MNKIAKARTGFRQLVARGIGLPLPHNQYDNFKHCVHITNHNVGEHTNSHTNLTITNSNRILVWSPAYLSTKQCDGFMLFANAVTISNNTNNTSEIALPSTSLNGFFEGETSVNYDEEKEILFEILKRININPNDPIEKHIHFDSKYGYTDNKLKSSVYPINHLLWRNNTREIGKKIKVMGDLIKPYTVYSEI